MVGEAVFLPLGLVVDDMRASLGQIVEQNLRDRQHQRGRAVFDQRDVELAPGDERLGEEPAAPAGLALCDLRGGVGPGNHRGSVDPQRGMLAVRLDDHLLAFGNIGAVGPPRRGRDTFSRENDLRPHLRSGPVKRGGGCAGEAQAKPLHQPHRFGRPAAIAADRFNEVEDDQGPPA